MHSLVDLEQTTQEIMKTEEMLAYAVFSVAVEGAAPLEGFCKISRPKKLSGLKYFSVLYIIDTPDDVSRKAVDQMAASIDWKQLKQMLPEIEDVMEIPYQSSLDNFFIEREIFVKNADCLTKEFIYYTLYPTLVRLSGFQSNELLFWDPEDKQKTLQPPTEGEGNRSLIEKLRDFFSL